MIRVAGNIGSVLLATAIIAGLTLTLSGWRPDTREVEPLVTRQRQTDKVMESAAASYFNCNAFVLYHRDRTSQGMSPDNEEDATNPESRLTLYRDKDWMKLEPRRRWEFVGGIEQVGAKKSLRYRELSKRGRIGCVKFHFTGKNSPYEAEAEFYDTNNFGRSLKAALYCENGSEGDSPQHSPYWAAFADHPCKVLAWSIRIDGRIHTFVFSAPPEEGALGLSLPLALSQFLMVITNGNKMLANELLKEVEAKGPWYPCGESGCCRAY